ncbi:MAG: DUF5711 family protein [Lachnospiraceae bacterium]|nr:DUF5711 family protein [Lachnospiraceae bacterium]
MPDIHLVRDGEKERDDDHLKRRIRQHRLSYVRSGLVVAAVLAVICLIVYVRYRLRVYDTCAVVDAVDMKVGASSSFQTIGNSLLWYGKDGAGCIDSAGKSVWNITYDMQTPVTVVAGKTGAICDKGGSVIYLFSEDKPLTEIECLKPVSRVAVSEGGFVAAVMDESDVTWIYLYDETGGEIARFKATMQASGYPVSVAVSPTGKLVAVSYLSVKGDETQTDVAFYNFGGVGQNETDNLVSGYNYKDIVAPVLRFVSEDTCVAVSDTRIMFYKGAEKPVSIGESIISDEIRSVYFGDGCAGLVFESTEAGQSYRLDVYGGSGNLTFSHDFSIDYKDILLRNGYVYIYNETDCIITTGTGRLKYNGNLGVGTKVLIPSPSSIRKLTLYGEGRTYTGELR